MPYIQAATAGVDDKWTVGWYTTDKSISSVFLAGIYPPAGERQAGPAQDDLAPYIGTPATRVTISYEALVRVLQAESEVMLMIV